MDTITETEIDNKIQLLADGELPLNEQTKLLRDIDAFHPKQWKSLSLSLIEVQMIARGYQLFNTESDNPPISIPIEVKSQSKLKWLGVAAALIASFTLAWQLKQDNSTIATVTEKPEVTRPKIEDPIPISNKEQDAPFVAQMQKQIPTLQPVVDVLRPHGMTTQAETEFYTAQIGDSQLLIPITHLQIQPIDNVRH